MKIIERTYRENDRRALLDAGIHPLLAKIYAGRSIRSAAELTYTPAGLLPPTLKGMEQAAISASSTASTEPPESTSYRRWRRRRSSRSCKDGLSGPS